MNDQKNNKPVSAIAKREEEILCYWNEHGIFKKSLEKDSPKGNFVFYDGPPFATGLPHFGHILPTTMKDAVPRFRTMQGFHVERRWGWDCHGLPIENLVEKELGLATKKDIEELGIETFNRAASASVLRYAAEWKEIIPRLGRWVDMENDYRTMDWTYTDSVWWSFRELYKKKLVYKSFKSMHLCPRCETTLSNFEVNQGYKDVTDISVYVKFKIQNSKFEGAYLLTWTTTPWTLPGNVALAVNPDIEYAKIDLDGGTYIVAKDRLADVLKRGGKESFDGSATSFVHGSELVGLSYEPLFGYYAKDYKLPNRENGWKVYAADFVTIEDGTGIVHIAPAFGSDDYALLERENLPFVQHVATNGTFKPEVADFAGMHVKPKSDDDKERLSADIAVLKYLQERDMFFAKEKIVHSYPHCWRCGTPLLNYATSSWFVKVTDLKDKLVRENKKVRWVPKEIGEGRFGKWLDGARDWAVSRSRFWGAPLPVWVCDACGETEVIGSVSELAGRHKARNEFRIMRHGLSDNNVLGLINGSLEKEYHLTEEGMDKVGAVARELAGKVDLIFASPILRTRETAELIAKEIGLGNDSVIIDERLREIKTGEFDGGPVEAYHANFASLEEMFEKEPPGGENLAELKRRVGEFIYDIDSKYEGKRILVVSHEYPLWLLSCAAEGADTAGCIKRKRDKGDDFIATAESRNLPFVPLPHNRDYELDLHRPYIDAVVFPCACGGVMKRVPEVFDVWYDSGSMPYAQNHYPAENKEAFERQGSAFFPADFIAEGLDQTRGWFYVLMVLNVALFGTSPYKNVIVNGLVLAEDGRKMSKSLKNYPDLMDTVARYGADSLRYFLISSPAVRAEEVAFSEKAVDEVAKKIVMRLGNVVSFYEMYGEENQNSKINDRKAEESPNILDRWILARLAETAKTMTASLERYELDRASRPIANFVDDLSTWYVRRSRDRFKAKPQDAIVRPDDGASTDDATDRAFALATMRTVLLEFAKLLAPFMPFTAEDVYLRMKGEETNPDSANRDARSIKGGFKESVHLEGWPELSEPDTELLSSMAETRRIASLGLEARAKANIKVRQPLSLLRVKKMNVKPEFERDLTLLIMDEVNVKLVSNALEDDAFPGEVELNTEITPKLREEGNLRELVRFIQDLRKKAGLDPSDLAEVSVSGDDGAKAFIERNAAYLKSAVTARSVNFDGLEGAGLSLDGMTLSVSIRA